MSYIKHNIHKSEPALNDAPLGDVVRSLLRNIWEREQPVRLVFFGAAEDTKTYINDRDQINAAVREWYPAEAIRPLVSYVAQRPLDCRMALETQNISKNFSDILVFKRHNRVRYASLEGERDEKMVMTEGILADDIEAPILEQSREIFKVLGEILQNEQIRIEQIDRQWNYIENITYCRSERQNYQDFNDARSDFYADSLWSCGYPAATGIGTATGGVMVEVDAASLKNTRTVALDNDLQIAAHAYSKGVLMGEATQKSTPKFERARAIVYQSVFGDRQAQIYISGTAAIRGEESLTDADVATQAVATLENIEYLIGERNLIKHGISLPRVMEVQNFRVYMKRVEDYHQAHQKILERYPVVPCLYLLSDVCRDELLIEIEGTAESAN